jgi:hypothetical protein
MIGLPPGKCRSCDAPVSYFARSCPSCGAANLPNPVATIAGLGVVVVLGGLAVLGLQTFRGKTTAQVPAAGPDTPAAAEAASDADYGWIVRAMAECDEAAKLKTDTLHFLIVPVTPSGVSLPGWSPDPISSIGNSGMLLTSTDALIGLRNHALVLYSKPLTFVVSDPDSDKIYKWKPAVGVSVLKAREISQTRLKLGFEIPDVAKEIEWGPTINLAKGNCYWINPLIRAIPANG